MYNYQIIIDKETRNYNNGSGKEHMYDIHSSLIVFLSIYYEMTYKKDIKDTDFIIYLVIEPEILKTQNDHEQNIISLRKELQYDKPILIVNFDSKDLIESESNNIYTNAKNNYKYNGVSIDQDKLKLAKSLKDCIDDFIKDMLPKKPEHNYMYWMGYVLFGLVLLCVVIYVLYKLYKKYRKS